MASWNKEASWNKDMDETQEKVFTRISNAYLRSKGLRIEDGELCKGALDDGVILYHLANVLTGKDVGRLDIPKTRAHKLNNLVTTLSFLKNEGFRVTGIGAEDILNRNEKLILGLMWSLLLQYHVKGDSLTRAKQDLANFVEDLGVNSSFLSRKSSAAERTGLNWKALKDIVNNLAPGSVTEEMCRGNELENTQKVMEAAEVFLGIPHILDAKDLVSDKVDEKATMSYLSYFKDMVRFVLELIYGRLLLCKKWVQYILYLWITKK